MSVGDEMKRVTRPVMARVAPGRYVRVCEDLPVPEATLCTWKDVGGGHYEPVPENTRLVRVTGRLLSAMGMANQVKTLRRLALAGFIEMLQVSPATYAINLDSWFGHLRRVAEDEEFWEPGRGNLEAYLEALHGAGRLA